MDVEVIKLWRMQVCKIHRSSPLPTPKPPHWMSRLLFGLDNLVLCASDGRLTGVLSCGGIWFGVVQSIGSSIATPPSQLIDQLSHHSEPLFGVPVRRSLWLFSATAFSEAKGQRGKPMPQADGACCGVTSLECRTCQT